MGQCMARVAAGPRQHLLANYRFCVLSFGRGGKTMTCPINDMSDGLLFLCLRHDGGSYQSNHSFYDGQVGGTMLLRNDLSSHLLTAT